MNFGFLNFLNNISNTKKINQPFKTKTSNKMISSGLLFNSDYRSSFSRNWTSHLKNYYP